jgi:hypothetical protein
MSVSLAEGLPPRSLWPERIYTLPEHRYPVRLNVARELLDVHAEGGRGRRPPIHFEEQVLTYASCRSASTGWRTACAPPGSTGATAC